MKERVFKVECLTKDYNDSPNYTLEKKYDYAILFYKKYGRAFLLTKEEKEHVRLANEYMDISLSSYNRNAKHKRKDSEYADFIKRESMDVDFRVISGKEGRLEAKTETLFKISDKLYDFVESLHKLEIYDKLDKNFDLEDPLAKNIDASLKLIKDDPDSVYKVKPFVDFINDRVGYVFVDLEKLYLDNVKYEVIPRNSEYNLTEEEINRLEKYNTFIEEELKKHTLNNNKSVNR